MKNLKRLAAVALCLMIVFSVFTLVGCNDEKAPEGTVSINFWYDCGLQTQSVYRELISTYNSTQGATDGVYVVGSRKSGIAQSARTQITGGNPPNVIMISDSVFKAYARDGLFLDLSNYLSTDFGAYDESSIPQNMVDRFKISVGSNGSKTYVGAGESTLGVPFASNPTVLYYNVKMFNDQGINIISVPEEELSSYNSEHGTNFAAHGYAEYKVGYLTGDAANFKTSQNLSGKTVVKVFNNAIPMNWEELRNISKYFTKEYNSSSPTDRAFATEWWFAHGWSVGGDCIGWDGEKYNFTLADDSANYLVVASNGVTINGTTYAKGQTVKYEDKLNSNDISKCVNDGSIYELPSQKDALMEFLCLTGGTQTVIDGNVKGYGIAYYDKSYRNENFTAGKSAIVMNSFSNFISFENVLKDNVDMAVVYQYREYVGGSVYNDGSNEYLKVIGESYDGQVYTGELKNVNGTDIVGNLASHDGVEALVIPKNSDSAKYEAAWKFIRWASGVEGQKILAKTGNIVPLYTNLALSDTFYSLNVNKNYYAPALMSRTTDTGDWGYFEDGQWVTDWANDFNDKLRQGKQTLTEFLNANASKAQTACENTNVVIKGWR